MKRGRKGEERYTNEREKGYHVHVLLNAYHLRTDCKCCVETALPQRRGSDPEN